MAGAEIIHRNADAERAQVVQRGEVGFALRQKNGFRDLEFEARRRQPRARERRENHLRQVAFLELNRRKIHRHFQIVRPCRCLGAGLTQHPFADRDTE